MIKNCIEDVEAIFRFSRFDIDDLQRGLISYSMSGKIAEVSHCIDDHVDPRREGLSRVRFRESSVDLLRQIPLTVTGRPQDGL